MKMTENPPMRPQRQIPRTNRETTGGLLMSFIRTLSSSRDIADRDGERIKFRNDFNECDRKLNELISLHNNDLYQVMNTFSKVLNNLSKSKERLLSTREKLMNCQKLLHCKRNELNQLWIESVENRAQLNILEKVEYVVSLPKTIEDAVSQKHYVHASKSCIEGLTMLTDPVEASVSGIVSADNQAPGILSKIEALSEIRSELTKKKETLFESAIDDLHKHLYQISTSEVRRVFHRDNHGPEEDNQWVLSVENGQQHSFTLEKDDNEADNTKAGQDALVELTKCLVILNKVPDSMEQIRERCERELITIAIKSAQEILNMYSSGTGTNSRTRNDTSKWNIDGNPGLFGSVLHDPSLVPEIGHNLGLLGGSSSFGKSNTQAAVLSFAPLLGLNYDAYSHLPSLPISNSNRSRIEQNSSKRSAIMLKNFFTLLMVEFHRIFSLYKDVVHLNFQRLETSLYSKMEPEAFYSTEELWAKVQKLIIDLVECVSADSGRGSVALLGNNFGISNVVGIGGGSGVTSGGGGTSGTGATNTDTAMSGDLSAYFAKRRPLAGAMNAMNAVTKNTMTAVASAAASASNPSTNVASHLGENQQHASGTGTVTHSSQSNTSHLSTSNGMVPSSSTHNFLSSVVGGSQRQNVVPIFKFSQSSQAISWNRFLADQAKKVEETEGNDKGKEHDLELSKDEQGRLISGHTSGSGHSRVSSSMINKLFDTLREIATPSLDNLVVISSILFRQSNQIGNSKNLLYAHLQEIAAKFAHQVREQVTKVIHLSEKHLEERSTLRLFPLRSAYFENKLIEEAERSKLSKDESFQLMQQQQQLNSLLYPPILTSVVIVDITARELESLMIAMPDYREHYLECILFLFTELKQQWQKAYRKCTISNSNENTSGTNPNFTTGSGNQLSDVLSTNWVNDVDIMRTFKELPNWESMIEKQNRCYEFPLEMGDKQQRDDKEKSTSGMKLSGIEARRQYNLQAQLSSFDDSPEDIRLRNKRETDILAQNMLDKNQEKIRLSQICNEIGQFEHLAQLQESADWMAARCKDVVEQIYDHTKDTQQADLPDDAKIATLNQLVTDFREFSDNCLILIHLEVRFHCFYHLQELDQTFFTNQAPMLKSDGSDVSKVGKGNDRSCSRKYDAMHEDRVINPLLDDLKRIHEELEKASLKPHKMLYVFEGLDSLIKTIFITAVSNITRVKYNGIKRALRANFNIQKRLMGITKNRENRLDYCRKYFEILLTTPADIIQRIIEHGQEFEYSEYETAIILLHNSKQSEQKTLNVGGGGGGASVYSATASNLSQAELNRHLTHLRELFSFDL